MLTVDSNVYVVWR